VGASTLMDLGKEGGGRGGERTVSNDASIYIDGSMYGDSLNVCGNGRCNRGRVDSDVARQGEWDPQQTAVHPLPAPLSPTPWQHCTRRRPAPPP
jgi:hypothetical protein